MSSIDRAKSFMQRKARLIALTAVPLASLVGITAPSAKATVVTPLILDSSGTDTCGIGTNGGTPSSGSSCTVAQLLPGVNGVTGVTLYGSGGVTAFSSGGSALTLGFTVSGGSTNGGTVSGAVPVGWDFTIGDSNPDAVLSWGVSLDATIGGVNEQVFDYIVDSVSAGLVSGSTTTAALPPTTVTAYGVNFFVSDSDPQSGEVLTVTVPNGSSVDINPAASGVPEPGTFGLLGFALATLGSLAWWRKRSTA